MIAEKTRIEISLAQHLFLNSKSKSIMVTIISYNERQTESGKKFYALTVQGGVEMVLSHTTGNFYATAKKASIPSTFDEATCQALLGTTMSGKVEKKPCEPYEYTIKDSGEVIELSHRYVYVPESNASKTVDTVPNPSKSFSENGVEVIEGMNI